MINNKQISLNDSFKQAAGNIVSDMDGEKVMLSIHNGKYYNLGEVGGAIWDRLAEPATIEQLVASLMSEYEVERVQCEQQVISFLERMIEEGLIQWT